MKTGTTSSSWWGAPRKFSPEQKERKISWLELLYDLVYVIAIAKITHHLSEDLSLSHLTDYVYWFVIIYWGWLNGSLYYDLHGTEGLRTRLMVMWQMLIDSALVITIDDRAAHAASNMTIALMVMQLFIIYLWWSVGLYDKSHRKLNRPYFIFFLLAFVLMLVSLYVAESHRHFFLYAAVVFNYLPPFWNYFVLKRNQSDVRLSSSMTERLGLLAIILFGEVITDIVGGVSELHRLSTGVWLNFALAVMIVFALWWIFFTMASDRNCRSGLLNSSLLELLYIPALISLGLAGLALGEMMREVGITRDHRIPIRPLFGCALSVFTLCILLMSYLLEYSTQYKAMILRAREILWLLLILILLIAVPDFDFSLTIFLTIVLGIILLSIILLNLLWYARKKIND